MKGDFIHAGTTEYSFTGSLHAFPIEVVVTLLGCRLPKIYSKYVIMNFLSESFSDILTDL